jgi:uncharacterized SAM-binding protein YcdF (DUF218 family)
VSRALNRLICSFLLCVVLWLCGLLWFILQIPAQPGRENTPTDAIVALTGGSNRLEYGLALLIEGKGKKLFISGVHDKTTTESMLSHAHSDVRSKAMQLPADAVVLGHEAENTIGNAEETQRWLNKQGYTSIRLVTANYHMPRSLEEFRNTLVGITIVPEPVFPDDFTLNQWWLHTEARKLILLEYHKLMASKLRHWLVTVTNPS